MALDALEPMLESAERRGFNDLLADALMSRGNALYALGRRREAWGVARSARDLAAEHGLTNIVLKSQGNMANGLTELDLGEALAAWAESLALARKSGQRGMLVFGAGNFGYTAFLAGEWDAGLAEMSIHLDGDIAPQARLLLLNNTLIIRASRGEPIDEGLAEMERLGTEMSGTWHIFVADPLANVALARGDAKAARSAFLEIVEDDESTAHEYLYRAARPTAWLGDVAGVVALAEREDAIGGYGPVMGARLLSMRANVAALEGRIADAHALYRDTLRNFRTAKAVYDEAMVGLDMAKLLDPADPELANVIDSTRSSLERLGAKPYLEQLDAAVARAPQPSRATAKGQMAEAATASS